MEVVCAATGKVRANSHGPLRLPSGARNLGTGESSTCGRGFPPCPTRWAGYCGYCYNYYSAMRTGRRQILSALGRIGANATEAVAQQRAAKHAQSSQLVRPPPQSTTRQTRQPRMRRALCFFGLPQGGRGTEGKRVALCVSFFCADLNQCQTRERR